MRLEDFFQDLLNTTRTRAEVDNDFTSTAYLSEMGERLADAEEIENLTPLQFTGTGAKNRRLAVHGYDLDDPDDSVALAVLAFNDAATEPKSLSETEARKQFTALETYLSESLLGSFQQGREESAPEYQLAEELRRRGRTVTRYRLYLVTNQVLSQRAKDFAMSSIAGVPVEYHVWDVARLHQLHESTRGREELSIDLTEWERDGVRALKVEDGRGVTTTYLCALPARLLADLYGRYGSRLLEGNVRSYLSARERSTRASRQPSCLSPTDSLRTTTGSRRRRPAFPCHPTARSPASLTYRSLTVDRQPRPCSTWTANRSGRPSSAMWRFRRRSLSLLPNALKSLSQTSHATPTARTR